MGLRLERIDGCVERRALSHHRKQDKWSPRCAQRDYLEGPTLPRTRVVVVVAEAAPILCSHQGRHVTRVDTRASCKSHVTKQPYQDCWLPTRPRRTTTPVRPWRYARLRSRWCARNSGSNVAATRCIVQHSGDGRHTWRVRPSAVHACSVGRLRRCWRA